MPRVDEIRSLWSFELRRAAGGGRTLAFSLLFIGAIATAGYVVSRVNINGNETNVEALRPQAVALLLGVAPENVSEWDIVPLALLGTFRFVMGFLPVLIALLGFDQIAQELQSRAIRHLALRTRRSSIVWGKLLAQLTWVLGLLLIGALGGVAWTMQNGASLAAASSAMLRLWACAAMAALPSLALTVLVSSSTRSPPFALAANLALSFVLWIFALAQNTPPLPWLTPHGWGIQLLQGSNVAARAATVLMAQAALLTAATWAWFQRRAL